MERPTAERLLALLQTLDPAFGEIDKVISEIPDETERRAFAKALGDVFGSIFDGFFEPIEREYPDLREPD